MRISIKAALYLTVIAFATLGATGADAQTYTSPLQQGIGMYNSGMYAHSQQILEGAIQKSVTGNTNKISPQERAIAEGYILLCKAAQHLPNMQGDLERYFEVYPHSPIADLVKMGGANYYFERGEYAQATGLLTKLNPKSLDKKGQQEYLFRKGYCLFRIGEIDEAADVFKSIKSGKYYYPAIYYQGYINYINKEFDKAIPHFEKAQVDPQLATACKYHIIESKFMLKDYNYVNTYGPEIYAQMTQEYAAQTARILSESYFATNLPQQAQYYYELYSTSADNISAKDKFYAGMVAYTLKRYDRAIDSFSSIASTTDSIGQSAYYHMGQCYISLKNKHKAQEAFKNAAASSFDKAIEEDACFNYAKLSFDLNRNISPFGNYLERFNTSAKKRDEIFTYMGTAFLSEQQYDKAVNSLKNIKGHSDKTMALLQKSSLLRGIQLVASGSYTKASTHLTEAVECGSSTGNQNITNLASFWLAECQYRKDNYKEALQILQNLTANPTFKRTYEYTTAIYNTGYAHFKLGDYSSAIESFATYLAQPEDKREYTTEARLRLADSYFMNRNYSQAAELYMQIAKSDSFNDLYAPLQGAISYGLISEDGKKIEILNKISGLSKLKSPLYTSAVYEFGRTLVQNGKDEAATVVLNRLINNPPDSTYFYRALLEMGMIHSNNKKYDQALAYYKRIIGEKAISEEGESALAGIENIYRIQNKAEEFFAYLDNVGLSTIKSADERENMIFHSAQQIFLSEDYPAAMSALSSYLEKYPQGANSLQAMFYVAESLNKLGKAEQAAQQYLKVMESGEGAFTEIATLNYAKLSYQLQKYAEAANAFQALEQIAILGNNKAEGSIGKMRSLYKCNDTEGTLAACEGVMAIENIASAVKREALYIKGKTLQLKEDRDGANSAFELLAKEPADKYGAEAAYILILDAYDSGDFLKVEELTFKLSDSATPQTYWLAKSFIVLGDSYAERDETEQAKATFESIKENYTPAGKDDDIIASVEKRLNKIK